MKKTYNINEIEHTFEFGKNVNGMDIIIDSYIQDGRKLINGTTVFDVLPQTAGEAERMLKSCEWKINEDEIAL